MQKHLNAQPCQGFIQVSGATAQQITTCDLILHYFKGACSKGCRLLFNIHFVNGAERKMLQQLQMAQMFMEARLHIMFGDTDESFGQMFSIMRCLDCTRLTSYQWKQNSGSIKGYFRGTTLFVPGL